MSTTLQKSIKIIKKTINEYNGIDYRNFKHGTGINHRLILLDTVMKHLKVVYK